MDFGEQEREIGTIRERKIIVKLSDADCDSLARKCGEYGLTIGELIENFIGDLVGGTYSNGSDERDCADAWFERCWFGMFPKATLLKHLLECEYAPEDYLNALENLETAKEQKKYMEDHPAETDEEEASCIDTDIEEWEEELEDMRRGWEPAEEPNMDVEIELIKRWIEERNSLLT